MVGGIAWLMNLDAEQELRAPAQYRSSPVVQARCRELYARMRLLLAAQDRIIGFDFDLARDGMLAARAFCPTPSALAAIAAAGLEPPRAPPVQVLARVNRRGFCAQLGQTIPGARYVRSTEELMDVLHAPARTDVWVLKRDFAFAGRERRRVYGSTLDAPTLGFVRRSFARGEGLQVEPWLARSGDFAQHGYVLEDRRVLLGRPLAQQCDERGAWQSSGPLEEGALSCDEEASLAANARHAGEALAAAGYFGPFGIDAFRYLGTHGLGFQPRSEINARFSMGYPRELLERALAREGGRP